MVQQQILVEPLLGGWSNGSGLTIVSRPKHEEPARGTYHVGEGHSHPRASPTPSETDCRQSAKFAAIRELMEATVGSDHVIGGVHFMRDIDGGSLQPCLGRRS